MSPSTDLMPVRKQPPRRRGPWAAAQRALARCWRSQLARRAAVTVLLSGAAAGLVGLSYANADADPAASRARAAATAPAGHDAAGERIGPPRAAAPATRPRPTRPETVAVAWYAKRLGMPAGRVRALGSQRLGPGRLRVLVLADSGGHQPTAWVPLRHRHGGWKVGR
jgi:hypothetical protein